MEEVVSSAWMIRDYPGAFLNHRRKSQVVFKVRRDK